MSPILPMVRRQLAIPPLLLFHVHGLSLIGLWSKFDLLQYYLVPDKAQCNWFGWVAKAGAFVGLCCVPAGVLSSLVSSLSLKS